MLATVGMVRPIGRFGGRQGAGEMIHRPVHVAEAGEGVAEVVHDAGDFGCSGPKWVSTTLRAHSNCCIASCTSPAICREMP